MIKQSSTKYAAPVREAMESGVTRRPAHRIALRFINALNDLLIYSVHYPIRPNFGESVNKYFELGPQQFADVQRLMQAADRMSIYVRYTRQNFVRVEVKWYRKELRGEWATLVVAFDDAGEKGNIFGMNHPLYWAE